MIMKIKSTSSLIKRDMMYVEMSKNYHYHHDIKEPRVQTTAIERKVITSIPYKGQ